MSCLIFVVKWIYRTTVTAIAAVLLLLNLRLYHPGSAAYGPDVLGPDVLAQLRHLRAALDAGAGDDMQTLFPEGYFFTHVLYGLSWVEAGRRAEDGSSLRAEALREARWAWTRLDSSRGRAPFSAQLDPPYGVFYLGWRSWLLGGILSLQAPEQRNPLETQIFQADCATLAAAFDASETPFLTAYPGQAWPVDSVVAVAALRLHDALFEPRFAATIDRWLALAQERLDPQTGLLPHRVNARTGQPVETARGSSQSLIARFLPEVDPAWGRAQYALFRTQFITPFLGVPGAREYPPGLSGPGDVDLGPLVFGFSASATVVTLAAAQVHGDAEVADALIPASEAIGLPLEWAGHKRYAFGALPVGEAFLVWAKTSSPWLAPATNNAGLPSLVQPLWRWPFHLTAFGIVLILALPELLWRLARAAKATRRTHRFHP